MCARDALASEKYAVARDACLSGAALHLSHGQAAEVNPGDNMQRAVDKFEPHQTFPLFFPYPQAIQCLDQATSVPGTPTLDDALAAAQMRCEAEIALARSSRAVETHRQHLRAAQIAITSALDAAGQHAATSGRHNEQHALYLAALVHAEARNFLEAKSFVQR